jgi:SHS2 domain-containing protein
MGGNFHLLEHPSDIGILARGKSPEEALVAVSKGLTSIIADPGGVRETEERPFHAAGHDAAAQVVNWLNEILFFFDTEGLLLVDFVVDEWTSEHIEGRARGERFDPERHEIRTAVKAATYHQFEMRQTEAGCEIRVFVDV